MKTFLVNAWLLWLMLFFSASNALSQETAAALIKRGLEQRRKITNIHADLEIFHEYRDPTGVFQKDGDEKLTVKIWNDFERDKHRIDRFGIQEDGQKLPRRTFCWQCAFSEKFVDYQEFDDPGQLPKIMFSNTNIPEFIFKLNMIGVGSAGVAQSAHTTLDQNEVSAARYGDIVPISEDVKAKLLDASDRMVMVKYDYKSSSTRVVFDLEKGHSIAYVETADDTDGRSIKSTCAVSLTQFDGIWFPRLMVSTQSIDGINRNIETRETLQISNCAINQGISFDSLADMGVANDALVLGAPEREVGVWQWDGTEIKEVEAEAVSFGPPKKFKSWFLTVNLLVLIFGVGYLVRKFAKFGGSDTTGVPPKS